LVSTPDLKIVNKEPVEMNIKIAALLVCLCLPPAVDAAVNFDQGIAVKTVIRQAAASDIKVPEAKFPVVTDRTRDCKKITFGRNDPLASPDVSLTSIETSQDCQNMGAGQICIPGSRVYHENARIVITAPRELKPGQKEVFEICLWGEFLSLRRISTVYKYSVNRVLGTFELTPVRPG
jgi:hypothetical protein